MHRGRKRIHLPINHWGLNVTLSGGVKFKVCNGTKQRTTYKHCAQDIILPRSTVLIRYSWSREDCDFTDTNCDFQGQKRMRPPSMKGLESYLSFYLPEKVPLCSWWWGYSGRILRSVRVTKKRVTYFWDYIGSMNGMVRKYHTFLLTRLRR